MKPFFWRNQPAATPSMADIVAEIDTLLLKVNELLGTKLQSYEVAERAAHEGLQTTHAEQSVIRRALLNDALKQPEFGSLSFDSKVRFQVIADVMRTIDNRIPLQGPPKTVAAIAREFAADPDDTSIRDAVDAVLAKLTFTGCIFGVDSSDFDGIRQRKREELVEAVVRARALGEIPTVEKLRNWSWVVHREPPS